MPPLTSQFARQRVNVGRLADYDADPHGGLRTRQSRIPSRQPQPRGSSARRPPQNSVREREAAPTHTAPSYSRRSTGQWSTKRTQRAIGPVTRERQPARRPTIPEESYSESYYSESYYSDSGVSDDAARGVEPSKGGYMLLDDLLGLLKSESTNVPGNRELSEQNFESVVHQSLSSSHTLAESEVNAPISMIGSSRARSVESSAIMAAGPNITLPGTTRPQPTTTNFIEHNRLMASHPYNAANNRQVVAVKKGSNSHSNVQVFVPEPPQAQAGVRKSSTHTPDISIIAGEKADQGAGPLNSSAISASGSRPNSAHAPEPEKPVKKFTLLKNSVRYRQLLEQADGAITVTQNGGAIRPSSGSSRRPTTIHMPMNAPGSSKRSDTPPQEAMLQSLVQSISSPSTNVTDILSTFKERYRAMRAEKKELEKQLGELRQTLGMERVELQSARQQIEHLESTKAEMRAEFRHILDEKEKLICQLSIALEHANKAQSSFTEYAASSSRLSCDQDAVYRDAYARARTEVLRELKESGLIQADTPIQGISEKKPVPTGSETTGRKPPVTGGVDESSADEHPRPDVSKANTDLNMPEMYTMHKSRSSSAPTRESSISQQPLQPEDPLESVDVTRSSEARSKPLSSQEPVDASISSTDVHTGELKQPRSATLSESPHGSGESPKKHVVIVSPKRSATGRSSDTDNFVDDWETELPAKRGHQPERGLPPFARTVAPGETKHEEVFAQSKSTTPSTVEYPPDFSEDLSGTDSDRSTEGRGQAQMPSIAPAPILEPAPAPEPKSVPIVERDFIAPPAKKSAEAIETVITTAEDAPSNPDSSVREESAFKIKRPVPEMLPASDSDLSFVQAVPDISCLMAETSVQNLSMLPTPASMSLMPTTDERTASEMLRSGPADLPTEAVVDMLVEDTYYGNFIPVFMNIAEFPEGGEALCQLGVNIANCIYANASIELNSISQATELSAELLALINDQMSVFWSMPYYTSKVLLAYFCAFGTDTLEILTAIAPDFAIALSEVSPETGEGFANECHVLSALLNLIASLGVLCTEGNLPAFVHASQHLLSTLKADPCPVYLYPVPVCLVICLEALLLNGYLLPLSVDPEAPKDEATVLQENVTEVITTTLAKVCRMYLSQIPDDFVPEQHDLCNIACLMQGTVLLQREIRMSPPLAEEIHSVFEQVARATPALASVPGLAQYYEKIR
ncbi:hypothetical protein GMRT_16086 [Giardia muris]|uniref:Uncharacterized protein n=1 Tax=Giardia muris TaxID=5742 RepID=A0A4Z1SQ15_GIAMU|nr:hypothetical protein GMRT_16086 [Giardia muris]|eukprot:TNJ27924.1 hypothetical protein GMRT_16086 [Giardia muris]